jgi:hypothetical protein
MGIINASFIDMLAWEEECFHFLVWFLVYYIFIVFGKYLHTLSQVFLGCVHYFCYLLQFSNDVSWWL